MCQHVDCLYTSSENHGMILSKLTKFLHSFSGVMKGGGIIKFNEMFPYVTYHFPFVLKPIFLEILISIFFNH